MQKIGLDEWQTEVLKTEGNICLRSGRQVGKSTIISIKAAEFAIQNDNKTILVIASVERQAYLLFEKILSYLLDYHEKSVSKGADRPTKHKITLKNGSTIYSLPTGLTGQGIRGYSVDLLIADEAAFIPEEVWTAVIPMLAVTRGVIWLLSTPHGKTGFYFSCFSDKKFKSFHISSEECPRKDMDFLNRERARMTKVQYAQEYLGEFCDELMQFFPSDLISKCMVIDGLKSFVNDKNLLTSPVGDLFLGVDVARMGEDDSVLISVKRTQKEQVDMIDMKITSKTFLTDTIQHIKEADKRFNYKKIYIDDGGIGVGVFDCLLGDEQTKRKVVAINNSVRSLDKDEKRKKRLMKEDLYTNLLRLMEQDKIKLFDNPEIMLSLKSIQYEYNDDKSIKIFGNYSHITEALIRAVWCVRDKTLNIWVR